MPDKWPPERRQKQAERIQQWQPWQKSTGPKTTNGKARSRMNARKHGARSQEWLALQRLIKSQGEMVDEALIDYAMSLMLCGGARPPG
jgi:hypothetical protein